MSCCWSDREPRRGVEGAGMGLVWSRYMQLVYVQTLILKPSPKTTDRWWAVIFCLQWEGFFLCKYQWYLLVTFHWVGRIRDTIHCEWDVSIQLYLVYKPPETDQYAWVLYGITFGYWVMYIPIREEANNGNYALSLFFREKWCVRSHFKIWYIQLYQQDRFMYLQKGGSRVSRIEQVFCASLVGLIPGFSISGRQASLWREIVQCHCRLLIKDIDE